MEMNKLNTYQITNEVNRKKELARKRWYNRGSSQRKKPDFIKVAKALLDCDVSEKEKEQI